MSCLFAVMGSCTLVTSDLCLWSSADIESHCQQLCILLPDVHCWPGLIISTWIGVGVLQRRPHRHSGPTTLPPYLVLLSSAETAIGHRHCYIADLETRSFCVFCVFLCVFIVDRVNFVFLCVWFLCCQYQCKWLPGKIRLFCVSSGTQNSTHSLAHLNWWLLVGG